MTISSFKPQTHNKTCNIVQKTQIFSYKPKNKHKYSQTSVELKKKYLIQITHVLHICSFINETPIEDLQTVDANHIRWPGVKGSA